MRFVDFEPSNMQLNEIAMNPNSLKKMALSIGATAGIEFEMVVPESNFIGGDEYVEQEEDLSYDERAESIPDIINFFDDHNSRRDLQRLEENMIEDFTSWADEEIESQWQTQEGKQFFYDYASEYFDEEEAMDAAQEEVSQELTYDEDPNRFNLMVNQRVIEIKKQWLENEWNAGIRSRLHDDAYDSFREQKNEELYYNDQGRWLREIGIRTMFDVTSHYDINWPYWQSNDNGDEILSELAAEFSSVVGRRVNYSDSYHQANRDNKSYIIEPDSSIDPSSSKDKGLEFISPPLPLTKMLDDLSSIVEWANDRGCYTNKSTGLHKNVSIPNYDISKLDYVKLALLLGDEYILKQYQRTSNTYCASAIQKIKSNISRNPDLEKWFNLMREGLSNEASKLIHAASTRKYVSINVKPSNIEFRSPGGDWLSEDLGKLENTLLRFVVALDAAMDEKKFKEEYAKKLYKLLSPSVVKYYDKSDPANAKTPQKFIDPKTRNVKNLGRYVESTSDDIVKFFVKYATKQIPRSTLVWFVKKINRENKAKAKQWQIFADGERAFVVTAPSYEKAIEDAKRAVPTWEEMGVRVDAAEVE